MNFWTFLDRNLCPENLFFVAIIVAAMGGGCALTVHEFRAPATCTEGK